MPSRPFLCVLLRVSILALSCFFAATVTQAQGAKQNVPQTPIPAADADHQQERNAWFLRGRVIPGKNSAELRRRAYQAKMQSRKARSTTLTPAQGTASPQTVPSGSWGPLGPAPLASDASGNGTQDYHQVSGRATAVAIDPADPSGNTVFIGGAQGGVWKSINGASGTASSVTWTPVTDDQATLSVGSIAIQPGNTDTTKSVILVGTGEADNSADSYFGLGILRSADGGNTWSLSSTANGGALSFSGLGGTRMAFSTANTVVSAMAATSEGIDAGAFTASTMRGLYTSADAGQSWTYDALLDPGSQATDATSATSVAYNAASGLFLAAIRYHGFYSSPDGVTWTRISAQPGGSLLSTSACPPKSTTNKQACPVYRGEITVVPGRNEMYVWFISLDSSGLPVDHGIWQSLNGGTSWTPISDAGITNCGDNSGCGVEQGYYNLELLAVPNGSATDLYAGAINLYKCSINSSNPTCNSNPFLNLTHVYGCIPAAALAHVHPDQHALAYMIPSSGGDSGNDLMYFANDGGIYRALDGYSGLTTGSCSGANLFDDLNQNLGSMTQFVSFSQDPSDLNTLLGGTQDNGSPATNSATTSLSWVNVNGGDGGYNAIDPNTPLNWFVSNPDIPPGGLNIQECSDGVSCHEGNFSSVVGSANVGGDDGAFYFPYVLDPQSSTALLVGTCRIWRGPRLGGSYTLLSPNFDTFATGTCSGSEINLVRSLAAGGPTDVNGSMAIYAATDGLGPLNGPPSSPSGGNVWVTTNATAGASAFSEVTQGINPNQFPVSSVAIDSSDPTGKTAYVTIMGFTGGAGHVWQTTNAGVTWTDFTGAGIAALPDAPVNAIVVDSSAATVYVGTDVGVFQSSTASPSWTEVGPTPNPLGGTTGFLPNVAVTALGLIGAGGQKLLRASTYGRGVWQFDLITAPDFEISVSNSPQTIFFPLTATFNGTLVAVNGYANLADLACTAGATSPPATCTPAPNPLTPTAPTGAAFTVTAGGVTGDYTFNIQGQGQDSNLTHTAPLVLHIISFGLTTPVPNSENVLDGTTSSPVSFQVTAGGPFNQSVSVSCSVNIPGATCNLTPGTTVNPTSANPVNMTASVVVPPNTTLTSYTVNLQASTSGTTPLSTSFHLTVISNPLFIFKQVGVFPTVNAGSSNASGAISVTTQDGFNGTVALSCSITGGSGSCSVNPSSVNSYPASFSVTVNATNLGAGSYQAVVQGVSGSITNNLAIPFNVGDYQLIGAPTLTIPPGGQSAPVITISASAFYSGLVNASCDASALAGTICTTSPANPVTVAANAQVPLTAAINVPLGAKPGTYNLTINTQDTTGTPSHSFTIALTIPAPDFSFSEPVPFPTLNAGSTTTSGAISVAALNGFTGTVSLTCSLKSGNGSCSVAPASVNAFPASPSVTVNATNLAAGSYQAVVQGVSGSLMHTLAIPFNVGDYQLSGPQTLSLPPGGQGSPTITIAASTYYAGLVNASCDHSALAGSICTLTPANPVTVSTGAQVTLTATIDVTNDSAPGTYNININTQDTTGTPSHSFTIALTVVPDFAVTVISSASSQTVVAGQTTGPYSVIVEPVGTSFNNPVALSCSGGLPTGAQCSFTPNPVPPPIGSGGVDVVMTISTLASTPAARMPTQQKASLYVLGLTGLMMPAIVVLWGTARSGGKRRKVLSLLMGLFLALLLLSCAGGTGVTGGGNCGAAPSTPTGLAASATTSTGTTLNWSPSSVGSGCSINMYTVYENGTSIAGPTSTSLAVTGLLPSTTYNFEVAASDSAGISLPSGGISLTTLPAPTYTVTITGTSTSATGQLSHSATVTLIVIP
ncbi:MAG TPA: fibronectin type III domain-containing protein [Candidatus Sulfotelmatobacter sp.]|nr:fibronectin type III domain-containing protein [Candidatus Sulfotelmatobacter sp.]